MIANQFDQQFDYQSNNSSANEANSSIASSESRLNFAEKKEKRIKKVKEGRGRPRKNRVVQVYHIINNQQKQETTNHKNISCLDYNSQLYCTADELQFIFIDFFKEIREQKGFVYRPECRKTFSRKNKIQWSQEPSWIPQKEKNKIAKLCRQFGLQNQYNIAAVLLEASSIFAEQFTNEFYFIILEIYTIVISKNLEQNQKLSRLARDIFYNANGKFYLFSLTFRAQVKPSKKMPFVPSNSLSPYIALVTKIKSLLENFISW